MFDSTLNPTFLAPCLFSKLNSRRTTFPRIMEAATLVSPPSPTKVPPPFPNPPAFLPQIHFFAFCFPLFSCVRKRRRPSSLYPFLRSAPNCYAEGPSPPLFLFLFCFCSGPTQDYFSLSCVFVPSGTVLFCWAQKLITFALFFFSFPSLYLLQNPHTLEGT